MLSRALLVVSILVLTSASYGQAAEKAARKQLKKDLKAAESLFGSELGPITKTGKATIAAARVAAKGGALDSEDVEDLFDDLNELQAEVRLAYDLALTSVAEAGQAALAELEDGELISPSFSISDTALVGKSWKRLAKRVDKFASLMRKQLNGLAKVAESKSDLALAFVFLPVRPLRAVLFDSESTLAGTTNSPFELSTDLIVGWSLITETEDARLLVGGTSGASSKTPHVTFSRSNTGATLLVTPEDDDRWRIAYSGDEGNYAIVAFADHGPPEVIQGMGRMHTIGVR